MKKVVNNPFNNKLSSDYLSCSQYSLKAFRFNSTWKLHLQSISPSSVFPNCCPMVAISDHFNSTFSILIFNIWQKPPNLIFTSLLRSLHNKRTKFGMLLVLKAKCDITGKRARSSNWPGSCAFFSKIGNVLEVYMLQNMGKAPLFFLACFRLLNQCW